MHEILLPSLYLLAGICSYAAFNHLAVGLRRPFDYTHLLFAGMCVLMTPFAAFNVAVMQAANLPEFIWALRVDISIAVMFFAVLPWFIAAYTGKQPRLMLTVLSVLVIILFVVNLTQPYTLQYEQIDRLRTLQLPWGETVTRSVGDHGLWAYVAILFLAFNVGYAFYALGGAFRRYRRWTDIGMMFAVGVFLLCSVEGVLVRLSVMDFVELGPFGFLAMVIVMSVILSYETRQRLRHSEQHFRLLFENSPTAMIAVDPDDGRIVLANNNAMHMLGFSAGEMLTRTVADITCPEDIEAFRHRFEQMAKGLVDHMQVERRFLKKDGGTFLADSSISTFKDNTGKVVRIIASAIDITETKLAEAALKKENEKNRVLLRNASDGIHILDANGNLIEASDSFCSMLGYERDEIIGMNVSAWDANFTEAGIEQQIRKQFSSTERSLFETVHRRKDGSMFAVEVSGLPLELDGKLALFNSSRDITERKKYETSLQESELRFRSIIEQSPVAISFSRDGTSITANRALLEMFGYSDTTELVGKSVLKLFAPECQDDITDRIRRRFSGEPVETHYQTIGQRKDGSRLPLYVVAKRMVFSDGPVSSAFFIDFSEREKANEQIEHLAFYDHLTDLPNRRLLMDRLQQALASSSRSGIQGALLLIDLDDFKTLNDTLGHDIGDALLQQVADRLSSCVRSGDTVARLGGDEFVVMLEDLSEADIETASMTETIGEKILSTLIHPFLLDTKEIRCTASIGATLFNGHRDETEELLKQIDIAMYQAKKRGRNLLRFFDPQMQQAINNRAALEVELHKALQGEQFQLHYQIQVNSFGKPVGAEALIRWLHPEQGMISPAQFIPLAEETNLIVPIGEWVLETACAQLEMWQHNEHTRHLALAVNISAKQLRKSDFVAHVRATVQYHAIDPALLKLEITESMLLDNIDETIATMNALKEIGVQFSLDDFGTGYSSLQYLKRLPLNQIKIDQSFIRELVSDSNDKAIVKTIITMSQNLNLEVIAEGVETEEQRQVLFKKGCFQYQGYLFSKPVPINQFEALMDR